MTAAEDLRVLLDEYAQMVTNLDVMLARLDDEVDSLNAEVTTLTDGVLTGSTNHLLALLEARRVAEGWQLVKTFGDFGVLTLEEWNIHGYMDNPWTESITRLSDDSFNVIGMSIPTVPKTMVKCQAGDIERTVTNVNYIQPEAGPDPPAAPGTTTVTLQGGETPLPNPLISFYRTEVKYTYNGAGWDEDADIIQDMTAFIVAYDQIHSTIDLQGTYGILARASDIAVGRAVQLLNRNKYQQCVTFYEPYAAP